MKIGRGGFKKSITIVCDVSGFCATGRCANFRLTVNVTEAGEFPEATLTCSG